MKKMMLSGIGIFIAMMLLLAFAGMSFGFCVHNKSDIEMKVEQVYGGKSISDFSAKLNPGENACCHWSNTDCNSHAGKTDLVGFRVRYGDLGYEWTVCEDARIPACSDLDITGSLGKYGCVKHGTETCN